MPLARLRMLATQPVCWAMIRPLLTIGNSKATKMPITVITVSNSIRVKPSAVLHD